MSYYGNAPTLYLITAIILIGGVIWASGPRITIKTFSEPIFAFVLCFTLYHIIAPIGPLLTTTHLHQSLYEQGTPAKALVLYLGFMLSAVATYYAWGKKNNNAPEFDNLKTWHLPKFSMHLAVSAFLGGLALLSLIRQLLIIADVGVNQFLINRIKIQAGNQQFLIPMNFFAVVTLCSFCYALAAKAKGMRSTAASYLTWSTLVLAIVAGFSTGSRSRALWPILLLCVAYLLLGDKERKARRVVIMGVFVSAVIGAFALQDVRADLMSKIRRDVAIDAGTIGESLLRSFPEYENTYWLLDHEAEYEPSNGVTMAAVVTIPIPRDLWENKPYGAAVMLKNLIRPGTYNPNSGKPLSAYTTGIVAEGVLSFGQIGVIVSGIIMGLLLRLVNWLRLRITNPYDFAIWLTCFYRILELQRSEFMGGIASMVYAVIGLLIMRQWAMYRAEKRATARIPNEQNALN